MRPAASIMAGMAALLASGSPTRERVRLELTQPDMSTGHINYWPDAPKISGRTINGISRWPDRRSFLTSRREKRTRRNIAKRGGAL